ncbi:MAG TPA: non-ribosomal peptide synthetase, partial [Acidobacteria bacterium]|nr:non-ribosomal peptide synthetase [Acidobacteriota bacterium]
TLFMTVLAGWSALLRRLSAATDVIVGTPVANRRRPELEGLIGLFVNTLPLRIDLGGDPSFAELVGGVREVALAAYENQDVPFERLVEIAGPQRDLSRSPLFQVMLALADGAAPTLRLPGVEAEEVPLHNGTAKFELLLALQEGAPNDERGGLDGGLEFNADLFDAVTARRLADRLARLLAGAAARPDLPIGDLPLLDAAEERQILVEWNATDAPFPRLGLHELFEAQAARTPQATALIHGERRVTYAELDAWAGRLARRLRTLGVGPEVLVGVFCGRTPALVAAALAVLAAGGAYLPLDPAYPAERLRFLLADAGASVVLAEESVAAALPAFAGTTVWVDRETGEAGPRPGGLVHPEQAAYAIYTSGSTGAPKGVIIRHGGAVNRITWALAAYAPEVLSGVLAATSLCFDLSVFEIFVPLAAGGTVILADDALALASLPAASAVTLVNTVPSAMAELLRLNALPRSVRVVNLAGEPLHRDLAARIYAQEGVGEVHNLYGPSEDTTYSTGSRVERTDGREPAIGRPLPNTRAYVLDPALRLVPVGAPGELWLGGEGLARGYLHRPDLTADRFRPDPFHPAAGGRLYRTGDLARRRADGALDFLGRQDHQVKVRGFRIEPGEIEAALRALPGVREAVVVASDGSDGSGSTADRRLVAYVAGDAPAGTLRAALHERLPGHLVPAFFVALAELPRTPNGKVDRRALARLHPVGEAGEEAGGAPPATPLESRIAAIWSEILGRGGIGRDGHFFALGGHSLLATRVVSRLREELGIELPLAALFESPTLRGLARAVERARRSEPGADAGPLPAGGAEEALLSFAQERLWFLDQLAPGGARYNIPAALRLTGALDPRVLAAAFGEIARRHATLRTTFTAEDGEPRRQTVPPAAVPLPAVDLAALPEEVRRPEALRLASAEAAAPFDLACGPLLRTTLLRLAAEEHLLLLTLHHIVADGWSIGLLVRETAALYEAFSAGLPSPLPELTVQYADFALWQRRRMHGAELGRELRAWTEILQGAPAELTLPADRLRPRAQSGRGDQRTLVLDEEPAAGLRNLARRSGTSLFGVLLAAFQVLLLRHTGREDLVVGTPVANRSRPEIEGLVGFFVNTLALRGDLSGDPPMSGLVEQAHRVVLEAQSHQDLPFERLVDELHLERSLSHAPLVQVMLGHQIRTRPSLRLPELETAEESVGSGTSQMDLTLLWTESPSGLQGTCSYSTDLWDGVTVERLLGQLVSLLAGAVSTPQARLSELPLLGGPERHQLLAEWNDTDVAVAAAPRLLHERFFEQAARTPERTALVCGEQRWIYEELASRVRELSQVLAGLGVEPESPVGVLMDRTPEMVTSVLGILGAGGAYLPLDPVYPLERLALMVEDSGTDLVLTRRSLAARLSSLPVRPLLVDEPWPAARREPATAGAGSLAYLIYTSGSTGRPKGVAVEHRSASALLDWSRDAFSEAELSGVLASTSLNFDLSVFELFAPLTSGGAVILAANALELPSLPAAGEVTLVNTVPSAASALLLDGGLPPSVRTLNLAGEPLAGELARRAYERSHVERLLNLYGPSEDTTYSTVQPVPRGAAGEPGIGRPLPGTRGYVLDRHLGLLPPGVPGELYLSGVGVSRGYFGRPELTAERYLPAPFSAEPGARMYRTGDLVRLRVDGSLEYLGRLDHQVKVRGFRIEPGEIEAALRGVATVSEVVVLARPEATGGLRLVAYVVSAGAQATGEALQEHLRRSLPEHMIPAAFVHLAALPRTPNGKVDRSALPEPGDPGAGPLYVAPRSREESLLAELWAELLGVERVGIHDNFFSLGGHSLLAVRLVSRVRERAGVELPLRAVLETPTVAGLAGRLSALPAAALSAIPAVPRRGPLPLSFAQERLWFL